MRSHEELRAELHCLERRRVMLLFARTAQILGDTSPLPSDPFVLLTRLSATGPLELINSEAEHVEIRSSVLRTWLEESPVAASAAPRSQ